MYVQNGIGQNSHPADLSLVANSDILTLVFGLTATILAVGAIWITGRQRNPISKLCIFLQSLDSFPARSRISRTRSISTFEIERTCSLQKISLPILDMYDNSFLSPSYQLHTTVTGRLYTRSTTYHGDEVVFTLVALLQFKV